MAEHEFIAAVAWEQSDSPARSAAPAHRSYSRAHTVSAPGVGSLEGSAARQFFGDPSRWNPEQLLLASAAQCHMLAFLRVAAAEDVVVTRYEDQARGTLSLRLGAGQMTRIVLEPRISTAAPLPQEDLERLHAQAHEDCFIARSLRAEFVIRPSAL